MKLFTASFTVNPVVMDLVAPIFFKNHFTITTFVKASLALKTPKSISFYANISYKSILIN